MACLLSYLYSYISSFIMYCLRHFLLFTGMAKVLPIIDVLGHNGQNSSFSSPSPPPPPPPSDLTPITQKGSHISNFVGT